MPYSSINLATEDYRNLTMFAQQIIAFFLVLSGIASIHSLPLNNRARRDPSTTDPSSTITIPQSVLDILTDVRPTSKGLRPLHSNAKSLMEDDLFNTEV